MNNVVGFYLLLSTALFTIPNPTVAPVQAASSNPSEAPSPLYLLTYDHGGLVLWGREHFAERLRNAVDWLNRYPDFKIGLENEAHVYDVLAQEDPKLLQELRSDLKRYAGRLGIGTCTYGQPLSTFINEESNIRQIIYAVRTDQAQLGYRPKIYLTSEHALHSQTPQILAGCGFEGAILRTHFMMYGFNPTFEAPICWWIGLDGSRLPAIPTYPGEGAQFGRTTLDTWILTRYPSTESPNSLEVFRDRFKSIRPLLASRADDSSLRREELVKEVAGKHEYEWILLDELLKKFPQPTAEFKTEPNDFTVRMPWGYCGNQIWNTNRQAEVQVLTAERLAALESLFGGASQEPELEGAWKNLLVGQHHDVQICGLLPDAHRLLSSSLAASSRVRDKALQFFASRLKGEGISQITAFNPLSWRRTEWLETEVSFNEKAKATALAVKHGDRPVRSVLLKSERYSDGSLMNARIAFEANLPGLTVAAYSLIAENARSTTIGIPPGPAEGEGSSLVSTDSVICDRQALRLLTPFHQIQLHPDGGIKSISDRIIGRELIKTDHRQSFFAGTIDNEEHESKGRWLLPTENGPAPSLTAREDGFIADIPYTFELTVHADKPRLDGHVKFHFSGQKIGRVSTNPRDGASGFVHEQKLRFKLYPAVSESAVGIRDLPFAISETTNRYVDGNYWTAMADGNGGMGIFNRGTMGCVRETDGAFSVPLAYAMYYIWGTRMLEGDFEYDFALFPFTGPWNLADLHRHALEYNFPVISVSSRAGNGTLGSEARLFEGGANNVILTALYPQQGSLLARFFEYQGKTGDAPLNLANPKIKLDVVDMLGGNAQPLTNSLTLKPWQIRTVRLQPRG